MDSTSITVSIQNAWNIRGFMILSLCMQLILALAAPFRKKTSNSFLIFVVWSAYFLSDWAAIFTFGLISNAGCRISNNQTEVAQNVRTFWAAFLLIHLGGPDTITAFSLEDNALWLCHLVGLIAQLFVFLYIFVKTLPHNKLLVPTVLIFGAGVIKYVERTRALYLASLENLKMSIKKTPALDYSVASDSHEDHGEAHFPEEIRPAFHFHNIFKGLIVDIMPDLSEWKESREFILQKNALEVFNLISSELNFLYEVLYTKIMAANSRWGVFIHNIAYFSTLAAFILFCLADKDEFRGVDVAITYALLVGIFALDVASVTMVLRSNWTNTNDWMYLLLQVIGQGCFPYLVAVALYGTTLLLVRDSAIENLISRLWAEKLGSVNLLSHCFKHCQPRKCRKPGFIWEKLAEIRSTSREDFCHELWKVVFDDIKKKAENANDPERMRVVYEARGDRAIEESGCLELMPFIDCLQYDSTLLVWHVATEICYNMEDDVGNVVEMKKFSKTLSDYMMYLLVKQPKVMSAVAGIGHIRYKDTCAEAKELGGKFEAKDIQEFCRLVLGEQANITEPTVEVNHFPHSVLKYACRLVGFMRENDNRWEIMAKVWMELLSYAAGHCRAESHARLLSEGGEFITFVWILMAHYGVGAQFPKEEKIFL